MVHWKRLTFLWKHASDEIASHSLIAIGYKLIASKSAPLRHCQAIQNNRRRCSTRTLLLQQSRAKCACVSGSSGEEPQTILGASRRTTRSLHSGFVATGTVFEWRFLSRKKQTSWIHRDGKEDPTTIANSLSVIGKFECKFLNIIRQAGKATDLGISSREFITLLWHTMVVQLSQKL